MFKYSKMAFVTFNLFFYHAKFSHFRLRVNSEIYQRGGGGVKRPRDNIVVLKQPLFASRIRKNPDLQGSK